MAIRMGTRGTRAAMEKMKWRGRDTVLVATNMCGESHLIQLFWSRDSLGRKLLIEPSVLGSQSHPLSIALRIPPTPTTTPNGTSREKCEV